MVERRVMDGGLRGQVRRRIATSPIGSAPGPPQIAMLVVGGLGMLVGVSVWWLFWFGDAVPPSGMRKWGSALFGVLFFLGGLYFVLMEARNSRHWAERRMHGGHEPWGEGYRWSRTMPPLPDPGTGWVAGCVGAAALAVFGAAINMIWLDPGAIRGSRLLVYSLTILFTLIVAAMLVAALKYALRSLRSRGARLHLREYPAAPGGRVVAELELPKRCTSAGQLKATLACIEEARRAADSAVAPGRLVVEIVAARETRTRLAAASAEGQRPVIEFELPLDVSPTVLEGEGGARRYWVLEVSLSAGVGWTFLIPVYAA